jgi:hypothetical protein
MRGLFPEYAEDCETAAVFYVLDRVAEGRRISPAEARRVFEAVVYSQPNTDGAAAQNAEG